MYMRENPLRTLHRFGQSIWIDSISRGMITSGDLGRFIQEDGVLGVTSNPAIFEKAIAGSSDYDKAISSLALQGKALQEVYEELVVSDIRAAADLFLPVYERTGGGDGFVSLEVSPHLAHDTIATIDEARRLWRSVDRPNVMIKVPGTWAGIAALRRLIAEGININVTLLFCLKRYRAVAWAYVDALEERAGQGLSLTHVRSVASFFLSRIDVLIDSLLEKKRAEIAPDLFASLYGEVALASAKSAYCMFQEIFSSKQFKRLAGQGACPQRLLWASTGTKNPAFSDVKYIEPLIGPDTVNTVPLETLIAYREHGNPLPRLESGGKESQRILDLLGEVGINLDAVTERLEEEGLIKFVEPFDRLLENIETKRIATLRK